MSELIRRTATGGPTFRVLNFSSAALRLARGVLLLVLAVVAIPRAQAQDLYISPLAPPDTSSPRATLKSFRENMHEAFGAYYEGRDILLFGESAAEKRAIASLDTRQLPPIRAERLASETALILHDVLDRVALPAYDEIPDAQAMAELPSDHRRVWRIPGTGMEIARVTEGRRAGEYLFSPRTVARAREFYELARNLSYQPGAMDGLYERVIYEPGPWISSRSIRALPDWARRTAVGQSVWKWIAMFLTSGVWLSLVYVAHL